MARLFKLVLGLTLVALQAVIFAQALWGGHISRLDRQYYIDHTRSCWLPAAQIPPALAALQTPSFPLPAPARCYLFMRGWLPTGYANRHHAWLDLPAPPNATAVTLRLTSTTAFTVNGQPVAPQSGLFTLTLPVHGDTILTFTGPGLWHRLTLGLVGVSWRN